MWLELDGKIRPRTNNRKIFKPRLSRLYKTLEPINATRTALNIPIANLQGVKNFQSIVS